MKTKPYVGQRVVLNDKGISQIKCTTVQETREALKPVTIVYVGDEMCPGYWAIDVSGFLGMFLFTNDDFDVV